MALSCRAQAFSVDNLLRTSEKTSVANDISSSPEPVLSPPQRQCHSLHVHSWATHSRFANSPELPVTSNNSPDHIFHSATYDNSAKALVRDHDLTHRKELPINGQLKRACQDELNHYYQIYKFPRIISNNDSDQEDNTASRHSPGADDKDAERQDSRIGSWCQASESSRLQASCFCHREMTFCNHPAVMSITENGSSDSSIVAELCHADLWNSFHRLGTEMIITKSGRRMFPALKLRINGLNPDKHYIVRLEFVQPDTRKYRYIYHSSRWMVTGSGDKLNTPQEHRNPERPASGQAICSQILSFERLKLTNTETSRTGQVSLISMQKFQPRVVVQEVHNTSCSDVEHSERYVITFPQTSFMAVTAYQNQQVTTLKIASNPFAKGFRESGKARGPFESFVTGLPNVLSCNTSESYLPQLMRPSGWPGYFQRDLISNFVKKRCNTQASWTASEDLPIQILQTVGKNGGTDYHNFETKRESLPVDEELYKSLEMVDDHPLLPHESYPLHFHQRHHEDNKHQQHKHHHQQQRLSKQQFHIHRLFHPLPVDGELLPHIRVPTDDILTPNVLFQKLPIQEMLHASPRSEHISVNIKSEHPPNHLSNVYTTTMNPSSANILPRKNSLALGDDSASCECSRLSHSGKLLVEGQQLPTYVISPGSCVEHEWTITNSCRKPSQDACCVTPLPAVKPIKIEGQAIISRIECD